MNHKTAVEEILFMGLDSKMLHFDAMKFLEGDCRPWSLERNREASGRADTVPNEVVQQFAGASTIDPKLAFCDSAACKVMKGGIFLMRYTNHLTNEGSL